MQTETEVRERQSSSIKTTMPKIQADVYALFDHTLAFLGQTWHIGDILERFGSGQEREVKNALRRLIGSGLIRECSPKNFVLVTERRVNED